MKNSGQGLVEYALLLVLVAMVVIGALAITGDGLNEIFGRVGDELALNGSTGEEDPNETPVPVDITVQVFLEPETPIRNIQIDAFDASENTWSVQH
jgi:pilus assembly protein Flp/PilA